MWDLYHAKKEKGEALRHLRQTRTTLWWANSYFDKDGNVTQMKDKAMNFVTFGDAQEWAKEHEIELGGSSYIQEKEYKYWVP